MLEIKFILVPKKYRKVMELYFFKGMKKSRICKKLNISTYNLKKTLKEIINIIDYQEYF